NSAQLSSRTAIHLRTSGQHFITLLRFENLHVGNFLQTSRHLKTGKNLVDSPAGQSGQCSNGRRGGCHRHRLHFISEPYGLGQLKKGNVVLIGEITVLLVNDETLGEVEPFGHLLPSIDSGDHHHHVVPSWIANAFRKDGAVGGSEDVPLGNDRSGAKVVAHFVQQSEGDHVRVGVLDGCFPAYNDRFNSWKSFYTGCCCALGRQSKDEERTPKDINLLWGDKVKLNGKVEGNLRLRAKLKAVAPNQVQHCHASLHQRHQASHAGARTGSEGIVGVLVERRL
ncbi:hypothetical protein TYRP_015977, partial [Tyrophagus putrescentiae]